MTVERTPANMAMLAAAVIGSMSRRDLEEYVENCLIEIYKGSDEWNNELFQEDWEKQVNKGVKP